MIRSGRNVNASTRNTCENKHSRLRDTSRVVIITMPLCGLLYYTTILKSLLYSIRPLPRLRRRLFLRPRNRLYPGPSRTKFRSVPRWCGRCALPRLSRGARWTLSRRPISSLGR